MIIEKDVQVPLHNGTVRRCVPPRWRRQTFSGDFRYRPLQKDKIWEAGGDSLS